jgi:hypothetical protein
MDPEAIAKIVTEAIEEKRHALQEKQRRARQWNFTLEAAAVDAQLEILGNLETAILHRLAAP